MAYSRFAAAEKRSVPWRRPPASEREAEHEQRVAEDRADERRRDDLDEARLEREDREEQLGQVAERRLDDAGRGRAQAMGQPLGGLADRDRAAGEGDDGEDEADERRQVQQVGDRDERRRRPRSRRR